MIPYTLHTRDYVMRDPVVVAGHTGAGHVGGIGGSSAGASSISGLMNLGHPLEPFNYPSHYYTGGLPAYPASPYYGFYPYYGGFPMYPYW